MCIRDRPTTVDAILNDAASNLGFYVGVLEPNSTGLHYATYYTGDHVDGGSSRFSKKGIIYQAVCSGGGFQTNADAYAPNQTTSWDIGVFKIDFGTNGAYATAAAQNGQNGCRPFTIDFTNQGSVGTSFFWNFDDGTTSTAENPTHTFTTAGIFNVQLISTKPESCNISDTTYIEINVLEGEDALLHKRRICEGETFTLQATNTGNVSYEWQDGSTAATFTGTETGTYWVETTFNDFGNCTQIDSFTVYIADIGLDLGDDVINVSTGVYTLDAYINDATYLWSNGSTESSITVYETGTYWVAVYLEGCIYTEEVFLHFQRMPIGDDDDMPLAKVISDDEFDMLLAKTKAFPNPMKQQLSVEIDNTVFEQAKRKTAVIYDNLGRKVYENELRNANETINVSHFSAGFYVLQIDVDGKQWTQKVVKE